MNQQEILQCQDCEDFYNTKNRLPRMLIKCGHSICENCLKNYASKNLQLYCLNCENDDNVYEPKFDYQKQFPISQTLVEMIQSMPNDDSSSYDDLSQQSNTSENDYKSNNQSLSSDPEDIPIQTIKSPIIEKNSSVLTDKKNFLTKNNDEQSHDNSQEIDVSIYSDKQINRCQQHQLKQSVICLTCQKRYCLKCVLFEGHKDHVYQEDKVFYTNVEKFQNEMNKKLKKIDDVESLVKKDFMNKYYHQQAQEKKIQIKQEVEDFYGQVMLKFQKKKKEFFSQLDEKFKNQEMIYNNKLNSIIDSSNQNSILVRGQIKEYLKVIESQYDYQENEKQIIKLFKNNKKEKIQNKTKELLKGYQNKIQNVQKSIQELLKSTSVIFNEQINYELVSLKMITQELEENDELNLSEEEDSQNLITSNISIQSQDNLVDLIQQSPLEKNHINNISNFGSQNRSHNDIQNRSHFTDIYRQNTIQQQKQIDMDIMQKYKQKTFIDQQPQGFTQQRNTRNTIQMPNLGFGNILNQQTSLYQDFQSKQQLLQQGRLRNNHSQSSANLNLGGFKTAQQSRRNSLKKRKDSGMLYIQKVQKQIKEKTGNIKLDNLKINDNDIKLLIENLKYQSLKTLSLKCNQLTDNGIEELCRISQKLNVKTIDLSNNKLSFQSIAYLLELIQANKFIKKIIFKDISIKLNLKKSYVKNFKKFNVDFVFQIILIFSFQNIYFFYFF